MNTLNFLTKELNIKNSEKDALSQKNNGLLLEIAKIENLIKTTQKSTFEKIIEILSLGLIKYTKKYDAMILTYRDEITALKKLSKSILADLNEMHKTISDLEKEFSKHLNEYKDQLLVFQEKLLSLTKNQYINNYTQNDLTYKLERIIENKKKFLTHEKIKPSIVALMVFYENSAEWVADANRFFVKQEKINEKPFFDTIESKPLTDRQQDAVLINENNNLVLAGAGSGKTSVIVAKVSYLIKKGVLDPGEILILAFNKNAQLELEERFEEKNLKIQIRTFHSFGLSIIGEALGKKPDICPMTESTNNMSKFIKDTIRELMASMGPFLKIFLEYVAYFSIPYKSESEFNSLGEYYDYQKNHDMKTLKHRVEVKGETQGTDLTTLKEETVKSHQELVIANFLTLNGICYLYEEPYKYNTATYEIRQYKPDFYLPEYDIYIEHFGIDRNSNTAPYIDKKAYLEGIKWKVALHEEHQTTLVQTFSYEFTEGVLLDNLKNKLLKHNVVFRELEFAEVTELLSNTDKNNKFVKLFTTFLNHYKANLHSMSELKQKAKESERTSLFLKLFEMIFEEYEKFQKRNHCIDFDDMIVEALHAIEEGKYKHRFKHIFIDEFQDISTTRAKLIQALLPINDTSITAVGDDWQSINRFAGSNIKIIQDFEKLFGISQTIALDYTFRFNDIVSDVASEFIQKNPHQLQKEIKTIKMQKDNTFSILLYWTTGIALDDVSKILGFIARKIKEERKSVLILARYHFLLKDIKGLKEKYTNLDISFSTVHGAKGNEADYVIILNLDKGKYGFPSKIEDDPILDIVIPESDEYEDAEERRLFYVALTRVKGTLFLLSDKYNESPFISELIESKKDEIFFINDPKIKIRNCPECKTGFLKKRPQSKNKNKYFYGCSNFPRCEYTENVHYCPVCKSEMIKDAEKKEAKCVNKECGFTSPLCLECGGHMIERKGRYGEFLGCSNYPKCKHTKKVYEARGIYNS